MFDVYQYCTLYWCLLDINTVWKTQISYCILEGLFLHKARFSELGCPNVREIFFHWKLLENPYHHCRFCSYTVKNGWSHV